MGRILSKNLKVNLLLKMMAMKIPMLGYIRPKIVELNEDTCTVRVPLRRRTKNHLNSMYFGALSAGADCAGGLIAMAAIRRSGQKVALIFKDFKADFLRRAEGDVHFRCVEGKEILALVEEAVETGERVNMPVHVTATVPTESMEPVAEFVLTLSLKKK